MPSACCASHAARQNANVRWADMTALSSWDALKNGIECPFDGQRSESNEHWDKIITLSISTLYLHKIQTYRGYSVLVFDPRHVTALTDLNERERTALMSDLWRAQEGMR